MYDLFIVNFSGLFLSLRGTPIDNDGFVNASDIGRSAGSILFGIRTPDNRLLCLTNATDCCGPTDPGRTQGNWIFPNETGVRGVHENSDSDFFARDRGTSVVRLHRYNNPPERGRFRCELMGDTIYVNICE